MRIATRHRGFETRALVGGALAALLFTRAAGAEQAGEDGGDREARQLDQVTVTARKREESLQDVPVAISAVTRQALENGLATDLTKAAELAPQVSMSQGGSGTGAVITVRGVSSSGNDAGIDQSVAIELDGVPVSRGEIIGTALFDMDQIQILQGPQALFFGRNSPAGVISLKSADPEDSFEGYATFGYENETRHRYLEGVVSGPLSQTLKARVAVRGSAREGWLRNVARPVPYALDPSVTVPGATMGTFAPDDEVRAARLSLLWDPTDTFSASLKLTFNDLSRSSAGTASTEPFCVGDTTVPVLLGSIPIPGADCRRDRRTAVASVAPIYVQNAPYANGGVPYLDNEYTFGALALNKRFGAFDLVSTTGYFDLAKQELNVSDWSSYATIWSASRATYKLWSEELRLDSDFDGPLNFMLGAYYEDYKRSFNNGADLFHTYNPVAQNYLSTLLNSSTPGTYESFFGQIRWDIVENLELAAGARYSREKKRTHLINLSNGPGYPTLYPQDQWLVVPYDDSNVSPEATLTWHPSDNQTLYAAYKTGYKSGGSSVPFLLFNNATPENMSFEPEEAKGGEIGYKAETAGNRLRFDLAAYRYNYDNLQVVSYNPTTIAFTIGNAASARIEGVQGSMQWMAADSLVLHGHFGYNRARYTDYANAQCYAGQSAETGCVNSRQDLTGRYLLRAPRLTYSLGADWNPPLSEHFNTAFSLQATHSDGFDTAGDYAPAGYQEAYWVVDASFRLSPASWRWELALIGRNLTDSYYMLNSNGWSGAGNPDQQVGFFNPPREVAVQATVRF